MRTGIAALPLHYGRAPPWLFQRMVKLSGMLTEIIVHEFGQDEFLRRISDPFWFQAFGCVLSFDWHSSGVTTTTCGALKEALKKQELGLAVLGGKGATSRKTPGEIENLAEKFSITTRKIEELKYASRMAAKVDSAAVQDNYTLYQHSFFVTEKGDWAVVQQGMNSATRYARRYHWLAEKVASFVNEPHLAICCDAKGRTLNMVAKESEAARKASADAAKEKPERLKKYLVMAAGHQINLKQYKALMSLRETQPNTYEQLLALKGIGPKSVQALALVSKLVYGTEPSWRDPVKYSFAHGGKDGYPYPVDRKTYDKSIEILKTAVDNAKLGRKEKLGAIKRLNSFVY